jgi:hypothetical protein
LFRNQTVSLGIEKNGGRLFRRPKLTLSCSAEGKEGRIPTVYLKVKSTFIGFLQLLFVIVLAYCSSLREDLRL